VKKEKEVHVSFTDVSQTVKVKATWGLLSSVVKGIKL
jgi:hypothetical protein